ncbi:MAG: hypothetical protein KC546_01180 [Anaerolineae bacterium]|nr:hypothetical protein [Anaerolineae bacterium]
MDWYTPNGEVEAWQDFTRESPFIWVDVPKTARLGLIHKPDFKGDIT